MTRRVNYSTQVDAPTADRIRRTVHHLQRQGIPITLAEATTQALTDWCDRHPTPAGEPPTLRPGRRLTDPNIPPE